MVYNEKINDERSKNMKKYMVIAIVVLFGTLQSQQTSPLTASFTFSSPIANMGFLSPDYMNPAATSTVLGGFINPASFGRISHLEFNLGMGFTNSSTFNTEITLLDSTEYNSAIIMPLNVEIKDAGGIYGFGIGAKYTLLGVGLGILKPFELTVGMNGITTQPLTFNQTIIDTLLITNRDSMNQTVPVEMHWNMDVTSQTEITGLGNISLKARPMFFGAGIGLGPLSIGAGLKIIKYSGDGAPYIFAKTTVVANVKGTSPSYYGSLNASASFSDTIVKINMINDYDGTRKAFNVGANFSLGFFKVGAYYEQGFETTLSGNYNYLYETADFNSFVIENIDTPNIYVQNDSLQQDSTISASLKITGADTTADTIGGITLPGYKALGLGVNAGLLQGYVGGSIPEKGELNFVYAGLFITAPVPHFKLRAGATVSARYFYTENKKLIPLSVLPYVGLSASVPLNLGSVPFGPTLGLPVIVDLSVKSNVLSLTGPIIKKMAGDQVFDVTGTPNPLKTLSLGVGVRVKL